MTAIMTGLGYLWTTVLCLAFAVVCVDYARRKVADWRARKAQEKRAHRLWVGILEASQPDYPRPLGATPPEKGWIAESRITIYAESDAEAIAKLTGEAEQ